MRPNARLRINQDRFFFYLYSIFNCTNFAFDASDIVHIEDLTSVLMLLILYTYKIKSKEKREFGSSHRTDDMRPNARLRINQDRFFFYLYSIFNCTNFAFDASDIVHIEDQIKGKTRIWIKS